MRFLDPKEEVFKIKITPYGKYLISLGKFNPAYYAFFDDDIVYDNRCAVGASQEAELQNDIEVRILDETPRFEGQTKFEGAETTVFTKNPNILDEIFPGIKPKISDPSYNIEVIESPTNQYMLQSPLGNSGPNTNKAPYYNLQMITGSILSASMIGVSGSGYFNNKSGSADFIPQVEVIVQNEITLFDTGAKPQVKNISQDDELFDSFFSFDDGTAMTYDKKRAFIKLEEGNTLFKKENFDIEVYEIVTELVTDTNTDEEDVPKTKLKKLYFTEEDKETNSSNVEYFFNLKLDNQIDDTYYCEAMKHKKDKVKNIFTDKTFKCPEEKQELAHVNIYNNQIANDPGDK